MGFRNSPKKAPLSAAIAIIGAGLLALVVYRLQSSPPVPSSDLREPHPATSDCALTADSAEPGLRFGAGQEDPVVDSTAIRGQFEAVLLAGTGIDEFILRHLRLAEAGNADSAFFVGEAMQYCAMDLSLFDLSFEHYDTQKRGQPPRTDHEKIAVIMDGLVGKPEFYRQQAQRHLDRATDCKKLGWEAQFFSEQGQSWIAKATSQGQPIARARTAKLDPAKPPDAGQLKRSQETMRDVLSSNRDVQTLLHASTVVVAGTGRDFATERLAWAILACEYSDCERPMNSLYRGVCEGLALQQALHCSDDMTDLDYLFTKYPERFDVASARAKELKYALETGDWAAIGL